MKQKEFAEVLKGREHRGEILLEIILPVLQSRDENTWQINELTNEKDWISRFLVESESPSEPPSESPVAPSTALSTEPPVAPTAVLPVALPEFDQLDLELEEVWGMENFL